MQVSLSELYRRISQVPELAQVNIAQALDEFIDAPQGPWASIANYVQTTPSSLKPGKPNRVDSGLMRDSGSGQVRTMPEMIMFDFGWFDNPPGYISIQEYGGISSDRGNKVTPMDALGRLAADYISSHERGIELREHIRKALRASWAGKRYNG